MGPTGSTTLSDRDLAEIRRSAEEARSVVLSSVDPKQIERYSNPPANTCYPLEYAFYMVGDLRGKTVVDLGCGHGENTVLLAQRGARVVGIDISPDLVGLAEQRLVSSSVKAEVFVSSAYETGLPDESVDVVFCIALIHHLDIPRVRAEILRILKKGGFAVLSEPIRFSKSYDRLRKMLQPHHNVSEFEHPLTREEFECMVTGFEVEGLRYFRLPFVPLVDRLLGRTCNWTRHLSRWLLEAFPVVRVLATTAVGRLQKP